MKISKQNQKTSIYEWVKKGGTSFGLDRWQRVSLLRGLSLTSEAASGRWPDRSLNIPRLWDEGDLRCRNRVTSEGDGRGRWSSYRSPPHRRTRRLYDPAIEFFTGPVRKRQQRTLRMAGGWNPTIERWDEDAEVAGYIA